MLITDLVLGVRVRTRANVKSMASSSGAGSGTAVRKRRPRDKKEDERRKERENDEETRDTSSCSTDEDEPRKTNVDEKKIEPGSYWLTRIVFVRALSFLYFVAFLVALNQNKELLGKDGLLPIPVYLSQLRKHFQIPANASVNLAAVSSVPSVMWWVSEEATDLALDAVAYTGLCLSSLLLVLGAGNAVIFAILWLLYHSIVNVGQRWYSFGWESQLLETGFLAIFLSPVLSLSRLPRNSPTPWTVVWGYRWLIFRIMLGATQPVPNPLSYYLHQSPETIHQIETMGNHVVELAAPFLLFLPRPFRMAGGALQILFQVILIISGNLSFLNWLTLIPAIFCFDDKSLCWLFSSSTRDRVIQIQQYWIHTKTKPLGWYIRQASSLALAGLLAYLSIPVVQNLLSTRQLMNTSFDSFRIVNTYGAFGSVTKERTEVILEGTYNSTLGQEGERAQWLEIEFKCKPGSIGRQPCLISPYHYRLDWLMWFAAFQSYQHNPWLLNLAGKILAGDPSVNSLLAHNPFTGKPPKYVRAVHYHYQYTEMGSEAAGRGEWWIRKLLRKPYLPIVGEQQLRPVIEAQGWHWYTPGQISD